MPALIVWLTAATLGVGLIVALVKYVILPIVKIAEALETVESHTKQLTANGGEHLADAVRRTEKKVDNIVAEQSTVRAELDTHRGQTAEKFAAVWQEIATRDIHRSAEELHAAADRAEAAHPRVEK